MDSNARKPQTVSRYPGICRVQACPVKAGRRVEKKHGMVFIRELFTGLSVYRPEPVRIIGIGEAHRGMFTKDPEQTALLCLLCHK